MFFFKPINNFCIEIKQITPNTFVDYRIGGSSFKWHQCKVIANDAKKLQMMYRSKKGI